MSASATFATRFLYGVIISCVFATGVLATFAVRPIHVDAAGTMADAMCFPNLDYTCKCGPPCKKGGQPGGLGCPCMDITSGFTTPGTCVAAIKCLATKPEGQPPMLPMLPMIPPPMPSSPSDSSDPCWSGAIAAPTGTTTNASSTPSACPSAGGGFSFPETSFPTFDTGFNTTGTGVSGINTNSNSETTSGSNTNTVSSLLDGISNTDGTTGGSVVPGGATTPAPRPPFGSADGISGDVRLQGTAVSLLVSSRDIARGTQVSGMFGFTVMPGITSTTIFKTMCGIRPWANGYLTFIVPSAYFDSLCSARGFALSARVSGSTAGVSNPTPSPASKPTPSASPVLIPVAPQPATPPPYLGAMRADIWTSPPTVASGQRTSVFWEAKGVLTCSLTSSDGSFSGSSLSGHSSTQPISRSTTFSIRCNSATSTVSNQVVVTVQ